MSEKDVQITYNASLRSLENLLLGVERAGDFYHAGEREAPMPSLRVEGAGLVSFPVPPEQAKRLIACAAERAPYGRGDRTLLDESVRKVWQIAPGKVTLSGKGWTEALNAVIAECAGGLGCDPKNVEAEFYKLLVYDAGGFFARHRDTEKSGGMFGTLIISLPSEHEGGELLIQHAGREIATDLRGAGSSELRYAAFYADCEHEVRPVTAGFRICLVYNLVQKKGSQTPSAPDRQLETAAAAKILEAWSKSSDAPNKLVYLLEHQYTQANLSFAGLKNADAARARILREAAEQAGCAVHLGIVHIEESGWAEYYGDYYGNRRRGWYRDEDDDPSEYQIGEVCDGRYFIDQWRNPLDEPVDFGEIPLEDQEILPVGALDGEEPDEEHFSEATGNEGASFERTYLRAAVVLWPEDRFDDVCISAGFDAALVRLGQYVETAGKNKGGEEWAKRVRSFALKLPLEQTPYRDHFQELDTLLRHLIRFGDAALLERIAGEVLNNFHYDARLNPVLAGAAKVLGPKRSEPLFLALFAKAGATHPGGCLMLFTALARAFPIQTGLAAALASVLLEQFPACAPWKRQRRKGAFNSRYLRNWRERDEYNQTIEGTEWREHGTQVAPEFVAAFLSAAEKSLGAPACCAAIEAMAGHPAAFPPEHLLLPALGDLSQRKPPADPRILAALWQACADFLLRRSSAPPPEPKDWSQNVRIPGEHPLERELEAFARDPEAREHRFRVRTDLRQIVHEAIEAARLDMTHVTERRSNPHTLVCTKTRETYDKALEQYQRDVAAMRQLLKLPPAKTSETAIQLSKVAGNG